MKTVTLSPRAQRALEVLKAGGFFRHALERSYMGGEKFKTRLYDAQRHVVKGYGFAAREELILSGLIVRRPTSGGSTFPTEHVYHTTEQTKPVNAEVAS